MIVKICGITNVEDARAAIQAGATALGFNFWPGSKRYLPIEEAARWAGSLDVLKVGVFVNEPESAIRAAAQRAGLDVVQLHGDYHPPAGLRVWKAVAAGSPLDDPTAEAYLVDAPAGDEYGGTGRSFDWRKVRGANARVILAGGLGPDNVAAAIEAARPWGVDACSRLESSPGRKDHGRMRAFCEAAIRVPV